MHNSRTMKWTVDLCTTLIIFWGGIIVNGAIYAMEANAVSSRVSKNSFIFLLFLMMLTTTRWKEGVQNVSPLTGGLFGDRAGKYKLIIIVLWVEWLKAEWLCILKDGGTLSACCYGGCLVVCQIVKCALYGEAVVLSSHRVCISPYGLSPCTVTSV